MIKSMTAFSQSSNTEGSITADITIRSYNSRYLDVAFHCPDFCKVFEEDIKKIIATHHSRGRVEIKLFVRDEAKDSDQFEVDEVKAASYFNALQKIRKDLQLSAPVTLETMLSARDVIQPSRKEVDQEKMWQAIKPAIEEAAVQLDRMRRTEGENLNLDLSTRINTIETWIRDLETDAEKIPLLYKKKLMERISYLTSEIEEIDPVRISQEAAVLADKSDVSEEIVRLYSHISQFRQILGAAESEGKKLNFLIQEFNREFNTIGSKAGKASLSHKVVDLKSELEKIREQVQNIE